MELFKTRPLGTCTQLRQHASMTRPPLVMHRRLVARVAATATQQRKKQADVAPLANSDNGNGSSSNGSASRSGSLDSISGIGLADMPGLPHNHTSRRGLVNKVQLSTYADAIGNNMQDLTGFLERHIRDAIGSIHMLPFYPSSADRGFAPLSYQEVDPAQGTWEDLDHLTKEYQLLVELMVNHISPESKQFKDYLAKGDESQYADMFIRWDRLWGEGRPTPQDLEKIRTRKAGPPMVRVTMDDGTEVPLWCTFSPQQIDIDPFSESGWTFLETSLRKLCQKGARMIRLDAFGYVTKEPGTKCFMEEPRVWDILDKIKRVVDPYGTQLLCEVHENYALNLEIARRGFWCYDFALPLLMLHALEYKHATSLRHWLRVCPRRQITVLDTHDGMGIDDIKGLAPVVDVEELQDTVEHCLGCNPNYKYIFKPHDETGSTTADAAAVANGELGGEYVAKPHQYNCTYFSALKRDPAAYLLARAIQFFTPGVPMVYYVGMLAGTNDHKYAKETGSGRDINRHHYSIEEAEADIQQPVVQDLLALCRFRNSFPAFQGTFSLDSAVDSYGGGTVDGDTIEGQGVYDDSEHVLRVGWQQDRYAVQLTADVAAKHFEIRYTTRFGIGGEEDPLASHDEGLISAAAEKRQEKWQDNGIGGLSIKQQEHVGQLVHVVDAIREAKVAAENARPMEYTDETSSSNEATWDEESQMEGIMAAQQGAANGASSNGKGNGNGSGSRGAPVELMAATADTRRWKLLVLPGLVSDKSMIPVEDEEEYELCQPMY